MCDPGICPDAPGPGERCPKCPLNRLDAARATKAGALLQRALNLRAVLKLGIQVTLDEIDADELYAMLIIEEEQNRRDEEKGEKG